jgi:hypothetical protein
MNERDVTAERIREEHLAEVRQPMQWAYLVTVLGGGTALMLVLIGMLEALG